MTRHVSPPEATQHASGRVSVALEGRYLVRGEPECSCHTFEIGPDGASLFAPAKATPGAEVILYLAALGRFPGVATRQTPTGFEMAFKLSPSKRERLLQQIDWFAKRENGEADRRRHDRVVPLNQVTVLRLPWGVERVARIESISLSGVSIEVDIWPNLNSVVIVGNKPAIVNRHFDGGFAAEFREPFEPGQLDETIRL